MNTMLKAEGFNQENIDELYKFVFENSAVAITVADANERLIHWNMFTENLLEMNDVDLHLKPVKSLYPVDEWEKICSEHIKQKGMQHHLETKILRKHSKPLDVDVSISVVRNDAEDIIGSIGIIRDISERKRIEKTLSMKHEQLQQTQDELSELNKRLEDIVEKRTIEFSKSIIALRKEIAERKIETAKLQGAMNRLRQSQQQIERKNKELQKLDELKSSFLNVTSHELRTPMSAIKGYIQMTLKQILGEITDEQKKILNIVLRNTDRLDHLIQDILDVSRLESGTMKFITEPTDIKLLIHESKETMQSMADVKHIGIQTVVDEDIPMLDIDADRIKQVLINLINNAIKFSPDNARIAIHSKRDGEQVFFEVQDDGRGIPDDKKERIFDTFYQVDSGMDRKFGGVGLGLAICKGIVVAHGGKIWVESKKDQQGSTFIFTLPIDSVDNVEERFKEVDVFRIRQDNKAESY